MKKIIISREQFRFLNENTATLQIATNNNDVNTALSKGNTQSQIQNAKTTFGGNVTAEFTPSDGPGDSTISVPNSMGGINGASEALKDNNTEVQKALGSGMNVSVDVTEAKRYRKKDIEEARLRKMRDEGRIMTKKQLFEDTIGNGGMEDILSKMSVFKIIDAYGRCLGNPDSLAEEWNIAKAVAAAYNNASDEQKENFRNELGI